MAPPRESRGGEKSILLRMYRYRGEGKKDEEAWFEIKPTPNGCTVPKEVFKKLPGEKGLDFHVNRSSCAQIGSSLYVLGGRGYGSSSRLVFYDTVRRLDVTNPGGGWKACAPLPSRCANATVGVAGNLIYLFPNGVDGVKYLPGGIFYDTSVEKGSAMKIPPSLVNIINKSVNLSSWNVPFCVAVDSDDAGKKGVLAPLLRCGWEHLSFYNLDEDGWKEDDSTFPNLPYLRPLSSVNTQYAVLNGIFYLSYRKWDGVHLYAYHISTRKCLLPGIQLQFKSLEEPNASYKLHMVAIADYKLCYLWTRGSMEDDCITVCLATVVVSPDCLLLPPTVSEEHFDVKADGVDSCIAFDNPNEEIYSWPSKIQERTPNLEELTEMTLMRLENEKRMLAEDNSRLVEENKRLLQKLKALEASTLWNQKKPQKFLPKNRSRPQGVPPSCHNSNMAYSGASISQV